MKIKFSAFLFCLGLLANLNAQEINKKQWTLFTKTSADWCPNCGTWGWNLQKQLVEKFENKNCITWAAHVSGGLKNNASSDIAANLGVNYHPIFFEGQTNMNASSNNVAAKVLEAESIVELNNLLDPLAGVGVEATINDDNTIAVKASVEFLTAVEGGNYFLGLYLVEDNLVHYQQNIGPNAVHRYVLQRSLLPTTFGNALVSGEVAKGQTFNIETTVENIEGVKANLKVAAILWNRTTDGKYRFFNGNQVAVSIVSSNEDVLTKHNIKALFQQNDLQLSWQLAQPLDKLSFTLRDIQGKILWNAQFEQEVTGNKNINLAAPAGTYILQVHDGTREIASKKLIKI